MVAASASSNIKQHQVPSSPNSFQSSYIGTIGMSSMSASGIQNDVGGIKSASSFPGPTSPHNQPSHAQLSMSPLANTSPLTKSATMSNKHHVVRPSSSPEGRSADGSAHDDRLKSMVPPACSAGGLTGSLGERETAPHTTQAVVNSMSISLGEAPTTPGNNNKIPPRSNVAVLSPTNLILPRNPKDTPNNSLMSGTISPKRRIKGHATSHTGSVKSAVSAKSAKSANTTKSASGVSTGAMSGMSHGSGGSGWMVETSSSSNANTGGVAAGVGPLSPHVRSHSDNNYKLNGGSKGEGREGIPPRSTTPSNAINNSTGIIAPTTPNSTQFTSSNQILNAQPTPNSISGSVASLPSMNASPSFRKMTSKSRHSFSSHQSQPPQSLQPPPPSTLNSHSPLNTLNTLNSHANLTPAQLDDEEQFMFEQRLTQDDLGVAIRKINHSGKAQLRYVKCVPLRPPSSSEFNSGYDVGSIGGGGGSGGKSGVGIGGIGGIGSHGSHAGGIPYLDPNASHADGTSRQHHHRGDASVSSRSTTSSRFIERIRSGLDTRHKHVSDRLLSVAGRVTGSVSNHGTAAHDHSTNDASSIHLKMSPLEESQNANLLLHSPQREENATAKKSLRALTWGKKNAVTISLDRFVSVRKGKTTERTVRNSCPSSRLLSIVTNDARHESLDIEAPTRLDRDKFAFAFSRFLGVPLEEEVEGGGVAVKKKKKTPSITRSNRKKPSAALSEPGLASPSNSTPKVGNRSVTARSVKTADSLLPALTPRSDKAEDADRELAFFNEFPKQTISGPPPKKVGSDHEFVMMTPGTASYAGDISESARKRISLDSAKSESMLEPQEKPFAREDAEADGGPTINAQKDRHADDASHVSSLTGGVDQEIVEELHQAIIELRAELDASRAEAARAVKVAEQAIQSAENCSSSDWNSTVTHKAAEAAAQAQKRSAEAIARARMAEERLAAERKSTAFWRRQAQAAEEEAGSLKTRSAAAEVKQAVMLEELGSERRKAARMFASLKEEFVNVEKVQLTELLDAKDRKRMMEVELEQVKNELIQKSFEAKRIIDAEQERKDKEKAKASKSFFARKKRQSSNISIASVAESVPVMKPEEDQATKSIALNLKKDIVSLRKEYELVRHTSLDEMKSLQNISKKWSDQAGRAVAASRSETEYLREKLAAESAMRLKLLTELQDIRGTVRVYCRPKPCIGETSTISIPTHDILVLNEDTSPMSFKYDRVFSPTSSQYEIFSELEEPLISSLDGFNVTLLAFGQHKSGKTHSVLGDCIFDSQGYPSIQSHGLQLQSLQQLFTIANHRIDRYKDAFSITIVEVHNEKLIDLVSGTPSAETDGEVVICETRRDQRDRRSGDIAESSWHKGKLEIRTNIDGNTVVQGLVSVPVNSFEDACILWQETISKRAERLKRQGSDPKKHDKNSNIITTINITSVNIATGVGTEGKLQFVDMASSDIAPVPKKDNKNPDEDNTHFSNKSIDAFNDVVNARCQFDRSVPYRNSTLTHLLRDSLEADAKVLLLCCVSSHQADLSDTVGALRFASRMQKVSIGKATKHIVGSKE